MTGATGEPARNRRARSERTASRATGRNKNDTDDGMALALRAAIDASNDAVVVADADGTIEFANHAARELFGIDGDEHAQQAARELVHAQIVASIGALHSGEAWKRTSTLVHSDGTTTAVSHTVLVCDSPTDERSRFVLVSDRRLLDESGDGPREVVATTHDPLTGLADRPALVEKLSACVRSSDRRRLPFAVLFCDLDGFKLVNDSHGHEVGDQLLIAVAERLQRLVRAHDTVARFGGDEFVILLEDLDSAARAQQIASRIVDCLGVPIAIGDVVARVGASLGVAVAHGGHSTAHDLLARADAAMYEAKRNGKNCVVQYGAALDKRITDRRELGRDLRTALDSDQLELLYRPVIDLANAAVTSIEASVRWRHPTRGNLTPGLFVDVAEATGMIAELDGYVLAHAARDLRTLRRDHPDLHAWVTLSARLLVQPDGAARIVAMLHETDATPGSIGIEISEDAVARNFATVCNVVRELADGGIRVALDNFRGELAIPQLQALHPHTVKLDRSFLERLGADLDSARAVRSVAGMIRPLDIALVAKGVDSPEQLAAVINLNCHAAQGAFAGDPTTASDLRLDAPQHEHNASA